MTSADPHKPAETVDAGITFPCLTNGRVGTVEVTGAAESGHRQTLEEGQAMRLILSAGDWAGLTLDLEQAHDR